MRCGITLAMITTILAFSSSCRSKKQYGQEPPQPNPKPKDSVIIAPDYSQSSVDGSGTSLKDPNDTDDKQTPEEITKKIAAWDRVPVVWGQSVGNIIIGETDVSTWQDELLSDYDIAKTAPNFRIEDANTTNAGKEVITTTVSGVRIYLGYQGYFELYTEDGELRKIKLGESLSKTGFFSSNGTIDTDLPSNSTRGRKFFREFYNTQVAGLPFGSDYDCFAETTCQYNVQQDGDSILYFMNYNSPDGATGALFISLVDDILYQTVWNKPELQGPGKIFADDVVFDLGKGSFFKGEEQLLKLGDDWKSSEKSLEIPEKATCFAGNMDFLCRYLGGLFIVQKGLEDRLSDDSYNKPVAGDEFGGFELNKDFIGQLAIQTAEDEIFTYPIQDDSRVNWSISDYRKFFSEIDEKLRAGILFAGGIVDFAKTSGLASTLRDAQYTYEIIYTIPSLEKAIRLRILTYRESPFSYISAEYLRDYQTELLKTNLSDNTALIGELKLGDRLELSDIEVEDEIATVNIFGRKVRVDFSRDTTLTTVVEEGTSTSTTRVKSMSSLDIEDKTLYLQKDCSSGDCQYELVAFSYSRFANENSGIKACNGLELNYGMSLTKFKKQALESNCRVNTSEAQIGSPNKTTFYLPSDNMVLYFNGENDTSLSRILVYKSEE